MISNEPLMVYLGPPDWLGLNFRVRRAGNDQIRWFKGDTWDKYCHYRELASEEVWAYKFFISDEVQNALTQPSAHLSVELRDGEDPSILLNGTQRSKVWRASAISNEVRLSSQHDD